MKKLSHKNKFLIITTIFIVFFGCIFYPKDIDLGYYALLGWILILNFIFWNSGFLSYEKDNNVAVAPTRGFAVAIYCIVSFIIAVMHYFIGGYHKLFLSIQVIALTCLLLTTNTLGFISNFAKTRNENLPSINELHNIILSVENNLKSSEVDQDIIKALKNMREKIRYSLNASSTNKAGYEDMAREVVGLKNLSIDELNSKIKIILNKIDELRI